MEPDDVENLTVLIDSACRGDRAALDQLASCVLPALQALARGIRAGQRPGFTLETLDIVGEAYLRLFGKSRANGASYNNRRHFFAVVAKAIRCVIVDHVRKKERGPKRDSTPIEEVVKEIEAKSGDFEDLHEALEKLGGIDPQAEQIVNLKSLMGFTTQETAETCDIPSRTVERKYRMARMWLRQELDRGPGTLGPD